jgi:nicotinamide-nucleotide amidase
VGRGETVELRARRRRLSSFSTRKATSSASGGTGPGTSTPTAAPTTKNAPEAGDDNRGDLVAQDTTSAQARLGSIFTDAKSSVGVAESLTGGELAARFASAPGASDWFRGGIVAYASEVKYDLLEVPVGPVVSETAAAAMAAGACRLLGADIAVAVTGVGGPEEQDGEPPGTVWLALAHDGATITRLEHFSGSPEAIVDATCECAVEWVIQHCESRVG